VQYLTCSWCRSSERLTRCSRTLSDGS